MPKHSKGIMIALLILLGLNLLAAAQSEPKIIIHWSSSPREIYNFSYQGPIYSRIADVRNWFSHFPRNTIPLMEMTKELAVSQVVIFSDVEFSSRQKEQMLAILEKMGNNYVVGLELFCSDHNEELAKYVQGTITADQLYVNIGYTFIMEQYKKFGYQDLVDGLKSRGIKLIGITPAWDERLSRFLKDMARAGIKPPYDVPAELSLEDIDRVGADFFRRDNYIVDLVGQFCFASNASQKLVIIIGARHGYSNHLPQLIEKQWGVRPIVVEWNLAGLSINDEQILVDNTPYQQLKGFGLANNQALRIGSDFFLNFEWEKDKAAEYLKATQNSE